MTTRRPRSTNTDDGGDDISRYSRQNYGRTQRSSSDASRGEASSRSASRATSRAGQDRRPTDRPSLRKADESRTSREPRGAAHSRSSSRYSTDRQGSSRVAKREEVGTIRSRAVSSRQSNRADEPVTAESLHHRYSRDNAAYSAKEARKADRGKRMLIGAACALVAVIIGCGAAFALFVNKVNSEFQSGKTAEEIEAIEGALADRTNLSDPFYMLLIGSDARKGDTEMGQRSDTCIVARVDPKKNAVTLISIPRDMKITYKGSEMKFNAAYSYGGTAGTIKAASELLGVDISHYAEVSFESLVELVDAVGGVEVDVPTRIDDWMAGDVVIEAGPQTLDGEAALVFARSRQYADGDFTRTSNQRLLVEALAKKVLSAPVSQMPSVIEGAAKCVTTDLSLTEIVSLAAAFVDGDGDLTMYSAMVPSVFGTEEDAAYVLVEKDGLRSMMAIVEQGGDPNTAETYGAKGSTLNNS